MAQWDVYPNPSPRMRSDYPFLVDLQSDLLSALETRFVAPLARTRVAPTGLPRRLCPSVAVAGEEFLLIAHEAGPVEVRVLKGPLSSLRADAHTIVDALDAVVSGL